MKIFYVVDPSGTIKSSDGTKTYKVLKGSEVKEFLFEEGKKHYFYIFKDARENTIGIEITAEQYKDVKKGVDRETYLKIVRKDLDISETSIESMLLDDGEGNGEEILADEKQDLEAFLIDSEEKSILRNALNSLTQEERMLINMLYFVEPRLSERQAAQVLGIAQKNVNARKKKIFEKIKSFFEN